MRTLKDLNYVEIGSLGEKKNVSEFRNNGRCWHYVRAHCHDERQPGQDFGSL
jgi:hypothetical protein